MGNEKVFIEFSDQRIKTDLTDSIKQFDQLSEKTTSYGKITEESIKKAAGSNEELAKKIRDAAKEQGYLVEEVDQMKEKQKEANAEIANSIKNYKVFGVSINSVQAGLKKYSLAIKGAVVGTNLFSTALKVLRAALISTGVGAIVVALGSLIAFLTQTQRGIDLVKRAWAGFSAAVSVIIDRLSGFGEIIGKVFTGKAGLTDLVTGAKTAVKGLGDEIRREASEAAKLIGQLQNLRDVERELSVERAQANSVIEDRRLLAKDETKSIEERSKALKEASALEQSFVESEIDLLKEKLQAKQALVGQGESLNDELDEVADLQKQIEDKTQQSKRIQRRLQSELNTLTRQQAAEIKAQREEFQKLNDELDSMVQSLSDAAIAADLELSDPAERARKEYELTIASIRQMEVAILQAAKAAGRTVDISEDIAALIEVAQKKFRESLQKIREDSLKAPEIIPSGSMARQAKEAEKILDDMAISIERTATKARLNHEEFVKYLDQNAIERFVENIKKAFGLEDEDLAAIAQNISQIFGSITQGITDNIQGQLDANQALIDAIKERRETVEDELDRELRAAELGYANNVELKRKELEVINEEEQKAQKEREKLLKKQLRTKLIIDAASQASSLATATAEIFKANASFPVVGIIQALASIAAMFAAFASAKAQAASASQPVRLYRGGAVGEATRDFGMVKQRGGKSDVPGRNNGHMVEGTNLMLGGHEWVNNEEVSQEHRQFLEHLNTHPSFYRGVDIRKELASRTRPEWGGSAITFAADRETIATKQRQERNDTIAKAIVEGIGLKLEKQTSQLIIHDERKDQYHFLPDGKMIKVQRDRNGVKIIMP